MQWKGFKFLIVVGEIVLYLKQKQCALTKKYQRNNKSVFQLQRQAFKKNPQMSLQLLFQVILCKKWGEVWMDGECKGRND